MPLRNLFKRDLPLDESTSLSELLARSTAPEHEIGRGAQGAVYKLDHPDPFLGQFLLKRPHRNALAAPPSIEHYRHELEHGTRLRPVPRQFMGHHYGQPLLRSDSGPRFTLLARQQGEPLADLIANGTLRPAGSENPESSEERYLNYLRWLTDEKAVPDKAFVKLRDDIRFADKPGQMRPDTSKKDNIFWSTSRREFGLIDMFDKYTARDLLVPGRRFEMLQSAINEADISMRSLGLNFSRSRGVMKNLLRVDGEDFYQIFKRVPNYSYAQNDERRALERELDERIHTTKRRKWDVSGDDLAVPAALVENGTIEHLGSTKVGRLQEVLARLQVEHGLGAGR